MRKFDSRYCEKCPYRNQKHLPKKDRQGREDAPLDVEDNKSDILLVFQAPGEAEWAAAKPLQPTIRKGGSAGSRVDQSWKRKEKARKDFNITNAVQCFPGKAVDGRDKAPLPEAVRACSGWLRDALRARSYRKVIAFGDVAAQVVGIIVTLENLSCEIKYETHPTGGLSQKKLDSLW